MANIRDVSKLAGVSPATVSLVMNNHPKISQETRAKVLDAVQKLNYIPNIHAKRLFSKKNRVIGVILASHMRNMTANTVYSQLFFGICDAMREQGYQAMVASVNESMVSERLPQMITEQQVDGIVLIGRGFGPRYVYRLLETGLPVVTCPEWFPALEAGAVVCDNTMIPSLAVEYLAHLGHSRIGFLSARQQFWFAVTRHNAFEKAMGQHGLEYDPNLVVQCDMTSLEGGRSGVTELLRQTNPPTAIIAANDVVALGAVRTLQENGYDVPRDMSVIGCDGLEFTAYLSPALTTIRIPWELLGKLAAEQVLGLIAKPHEDRTTVAPLTVPVELVVRQSCAEPRCK